MCLDIFDHCKLLLPVRRSENNWLTPCSGAAPPPSQHTEHSNLFLSHISTYSDSLRSVVWSGATTAHLTNDIYLNWTAFVWFVPCYMILLYCIVLAREWPDEEARETVSMCQTRISRHSPGTNEFVWMDFIVSIPIESSVLLQNMLQIDVLGRLLHSKGYW